MYNMEELESDLRYAYNGLLERCNTWEGRIEYRIMLPGDLEPEPYSFNLWYSGARYWRETHNIKISANTGDLFNTSGIYIFTGRDTVRTDFDSVTYCNDDELSTSECGFPIYSAKIYSGNSNPGKFELSLSGDVQLSSSGTAPDYFPVPGNVTGTNSINIAHDTFETGWEITSISPVTCAATSDITGGFSYPYRGQIKEMYEGERGIETEIRPFLSAYGVLLPSLWEVLQRTPTRTENATPEFPHDTEFYNGQEILNDVVLPLGISEGVQVIMKWDIIHINYTMTRDFSAKYPSKI